MKRLTWLCLFCGISILAFLVLTAAGRAPRDQHDGMSNHPDIEALVRGPLAQVDHWKEVSGPVRNALTKHWKGERIADPAEPFRSGCTSPPELPAYRMILAAKAQDSWLVCYEHGGVALSLHMAVVPIGTDGKPGEPVFVEFRPPAITDIDSLRRAVAEHRYWLL